ncbi:MAG: hypothetical protein J2P54_24755 [Bradyrhizobiaceae bacterium]|nr:hypothetical protein [Bradyrhizobiaceae bacterium]
MPENQEPAIEQWIFGGTRVGSKDRRWHLWIGPDAEPMHFKASGSYAVGSIYDVKVTRLNGKATMHGHPVYMGMQSEDDDLIDSLSAKHRAAEETLRLLAKERAAKRDDPVELAIARLCDLAANVPASQRGTFAQYVTYRLTRSWE